MLVELTGGRSEARVFAAHMTVEGSNAGVWPQPAFVKLDRRDKIEREHNNYGEYAEKFIQFGLRPNVQDIVAGSQRSLLVGNFVDHSESLWDLARRNVAGQAIAALVDETLGGWRDQGYSEDPKDGSVAVAMAAAGIVDIARVRPRYVEDAESLELKADPKRLWRILKALHQKFRLAPTHGDLHGANVRVRNGQAILIDLASVAKGPLTADLAALETWFAFELPPDVAEESFADPVWCHEIVRLYSREAFRHPPGPREPTADYCWMSTIVRQIRRMGIATQSCPTEYQTAVAVQLLRRSQWDDGPPAYRYRRSQGYVIAIGLVDDLEQSRP